MSRTIRRPELHLMRWWLPSLAEHVFVKSQDPWRQQRMPGVYYSKQEPKIIRRLQTDIHRFFHGPPAYNRKRYQKMFRQTWRREVKKLFREDNLEAYLDPEIYYPYFI